MSQVPTKEQRLQKHYRFTLYNEELFDVADKALAKAVRFELLPREFRNYKRIEREIENCRAQLTYKKKGIRNRGILSATFAVVTGVAALSPVTLFIGELLCVRIAFAFAGVIAAACAVKDHQKALGVDFNSKVLDGYIAVQKELIKEASPQSAGIVNGNTTITV